MGLYELNSEKDVSAINSSVVISNCQKSNARNKIDQFINPHSENCLRVMGQIRKKKKNSKYFSTEIDKVNQFKFYKKI